MTAVKNLANVNHIQVNNTITKENGDVIVNMPTIESQEKFLPILNSGQLTGNVTVKVPKKLPTISIGNITEFDNPELFIEKVKAQNPKIKEKIENGSHFEIIHTRKPTDLSTTGSKFIQVIARVSEDIRSAIKVNGDKIFTDLVSHKVLDRFYIRRCNKCQRYGHYQNTCSNSECCAYCKSAEHKSSECPLKIASQISQYKCVNCEESGKDAMGHSAHWSKCPHYISLQNKLKESMPFYATKN